VSLQGKLRPVYEDIIGQYGWEGRRLVGMGIAGNVADDEREQALATLQASLRCCASRVAIHELARLRAATKARNGTEHDTEMLVDVLSDVLCEYPEDAVKSACQQWRANNVFFPAEAELRQLLDAAVAERRYALRAFLDAKPVDVVPPTPERMRARDVDAILAKAAKSTGLTVAELSNAKPAQQFTPTVAGGLSEAQIAAGKAKDQAAYWLAQMGEPS